MTRKHKLAIAGGITLLMVSLGIGALLTPATPINTAIPLEQQERLYAKFHTSCTSAGGTEDLCSCLGVSVVNDLTPEKLEQIRAIGGDAKQAEAYIRPYLPGCQ